MKKTRAGEVTLTVEELEHLFIRHETDTDRITAVVELATGSKAEAEHLTARWRHQRKVLEKEWAESEESEMCDVTNEESIPVGFDLC